MNGKLAAAVVALFAVIFALTVTAHNGSAATLSPTHRACVAFQTWNHHKTVRTAREMLSAAEQRHVSATVRTDLVVLYTEFVQRDTYDLPQDIPLTGQDCAHVR